MHYTEYVANMQKVLHTLIPDAVKKHQKRGDLTWTLKPTS